jgi:hypothetical protein
MLTAAALAALLLHTSRGESERGEGGAEAGSPGARDGGRAGGGQGGVAEQPRNWKGRRATSPTDAASARRGYADA